MITGPIELAIIFRFLEFLVEDHLKGQGVLINGFKMSVLHSSSKMFGEVSIKFNTKERKCFKTFIEELENIVRKKTGRINKEKEVADTYQVEQMLSYLNENPITCNMLLRITEAKRLTKIVEMLGISITKIVPKSYYIQDEHKRATSIFGPNKIIYVSHDDNKQSTLYYVRNNKELIPQSKSPPKPIIFELKCGHIANKRLDNPLELRKNNPTANLVLKCPDKDCFYVTNEKEAKEYLKDDYDNYFNVKEPNKLACIFDGIIDSTNITLDSEHSACIRCMNCLLFYMENKKKFTFFNEKKEPNPLKCPVPGCNYTSTFNDFYRAIERKRVEEILKKLNEESKVEFQPNKFCPMCNKTIKKKDKEVIEHEYDKCNAWYHKACLRNHLDEYSKTRGLHEVFCISCNVNFPSEDIVNLLSAPNDCLKRLEENFREKAVTLICAFCGTLAQSIDCNSKTIKCKCGKKFCRYCGGDPNERCFPQYKLIEELSKDYKCVLPCPKCLQLNVAQEKTLVTVCVNCKARMCGECGANQEVIKYHGSKYHRPDCTSAKDYVKGELNCPFCKEKQCIRPGKLDRGELLESENG